MSWRGAETNCLGFVSWSYDKHAQQEQLKDKGVYLARNPSLVHDSTVTGVERVSHIAHAMMNARTLVLSLLFLLIV